MSLDRPPAAHDSGEFPLSPAPATDAGAEREVSQDIFANMREKTRSILVLTEDTTKKAALNMIQKLGGRQIVWGGLDQSGYENYQAFFHDLVVSVANYHTKLASADHNASGDVNISLTELENTIYVILCDAGSSHGVRLMSLLKELREKRVEQ